MLNKSLLLILIVCCLVGSFSLNLNAMEVNASGGWTETLDASNLSGLAGSLLSDVSSAEDTTVLDMISAKSWVVDIRRTGTDWPSDLPLYAKIFSDGTLEGTISR